MFTLKWLKFKIKMSFSWDWVKWILSLSFWQWLFAVTLSMLIWLVTIAMLIVTKVTLWHVDEISKIWAKETIWFNNIDYFSTSLLKISCNKIPFNFAVSQPVSVMNCSSLCLDITRHKKALCCQYFLTDKVSTQF